MFNGELYEYTCNECGNHGTAFSKWCHCEYCGERVDCIKLTGEEDAAIKERE